MQILVTHGTLARTKVVHLRRWQLVLGALGVVMTLLLISGAVYHYFFLQAAREGWPVVSQLVRWVVRDDLAERERYMQENLDAMAQRVGELQARLVTLQMMGDRVSQLAGVKPEDLQPAPSASAPTPDAPEDAGKGGPATTLPRPSSEALAALLDELDASALLNADIFTLAESRLMEHRLQALLVPSSTPVEGPIGSRFGFRYDPFNGRRALHTGLDFPAPNGTPVHAAAGGVVVGVERHPEYGNLLTLDHGNDLLTRYAHLSRTRVQPGDIVRRQQHIGDVGSTGRSTGPHLHFEVLVQGVPQNPARFLAGQAGPRVIN
ncbi:M23 family metallopeptidase [Rubrivivax albus]|uniref:M23 family metallopeptidase n=1 Tax=Rubrivivax albus TaxID=2499835 RepID=A0A3S2UAN4_9BURK|nr:M23 family metallopeptidase [Rubrivivax albus]RVT53648.1 M23 family metallopeptidase [Rubrivivax albus]